MGGWLEGKDIRRTRMDCCRRRGEGDLKVGENRRVGGREGRASHQRLPGSSCPRKGARMWSSEARRGDVWISIGARMGRCLCTRLS